MSITLHAQPYNLDAIGFYFTTEEEYLSAACGLKDRFGNPVEEFEIQFIDGTALDAALAEAWELDQCNCFAFLEKAHTWSEEEIHRIIIALQEVGYTLDHETVDPDDYEIDLYYLNSLRDLAEQFVDEGLFGEIPEPLQNYIDYDTIAYDLSMDYTETSINGVLPPYNCSTFLV